MHIDQCIPHNLVAADRKCNSWLLMDDKTPVYTAAKCISNWETNAMHLVLLKGFPSAPTRKKVTEGFDVVSSHNQKHCKSCTKSCNLGQTGTHDHGTTSDMIKWH